VVDVLRPHDHVRLTLELSAVPVRDEEGSMFAAVVVYVDVTERNRVEAERARIREELIRSQAQALAERSTPLLPLSDSVVAMAIVGTLDSGRADQILETLLTGCAARRARFAILDITGVPHADAAIAGTLLRAAAAVRLLGVEPVLTGIRPDVANALVSLDLDLRGLVTLSTLQDGIAYAIGRARGAGRGRERGA
jgi:rsbT co-antagonist protein RsbR